MGTSVEGGLEDVVAARSAICTIDGAAGRLYYRGYEIGGAGRHGAVRGRHLLLWNGELPSPAERAGLPCPARRDAGAARRRRWPSPEPAA